MKQNFSKMELDNFAEQLFLELENLAEFSEIFTDKEVCRRLTLYGRELIETNCYMNLTTIVKPEDVAIRHFYDSMTILPVMRTIREETAKLDLSSWKWIDVGTGAGFPGLALQIVEQSSKLTLLDSLKKRLNFLQKVADKLSVENIDYLHFRAEDAGKSAKYREKFDFSVARAVASLPVLCELCLPLVKVNGYFVAMKAQHDETDSAKRALKILGGEIVDVKELTLPKTGDKRSLIIVKKIKATPDKYPRRAGIPGEKPL